MAQKHGKERTGRTMPCNVCGKLYTDRIDKGANEITCPFCIMKGGLVKRESSNNKTINLKENIMPTKQGRIKPTDFTSSFKKFVNGVAETITINQYKTWKEMVKEVLGTEVYEKNKHASMYLVYKKYLNKKNDTNLYLEKIGEDPEEVSRNPEPVASEVPKAPEATEPEATEPEATQPEATQPTEPEAILTEADVEPEATINGSEIGGDTGTDADVDKNE